MAKAGIAFIPTKKKLHQTTQKSHPFILDKNREMGTDSEPDKVWGAQAQRKRRRIGGWGTREQLRALGNLRCRGGETHESNILGLEDLEDLDGDLLVVT